MSAVGPLPAGASFAVSGLNFTNLDEPMKPPTLSVVLVLTARSTIEPRIATKFGPRSKGRDCMDDGGARVGRRGSSSRLLTRRNGRMSPRLLAVDYGTTLGGGARLLWGGNTSPHVETDHLESLLIELIVEHPCHRSYAHESCLRVR